MVAVSEKQLGEALQLVAKQMHVVEEHLAQIAAGLLAVKGTLARHMDPSAPAQALKQIQDLEAVIAKRDPNAAERKKVSEVFEMLKLLEKHGGPSEA
jgi:hypothetical protein